MPRMGRLEREGQRGCFDGQGVFGYYRGIWVACGELKSWL